MDQIEQLKIMRDEALARLQANPDFKLVNSLDSLITDLETVLGPVPAARDNGADGGSELTEPGLPVSHEPQPDLQIAAAQPAAAPPAVERADPAQTDTPDAPAQPAAAEKPADPTPVGLGNSQESPAVQPPAEPAGEAAAGDDEPTPQASPTQPPEPAGTATVSREDEEAIIEALEAELTLTSSELAPPEPQQGDADKDVEPDTGGAPGDPAAPDGGEDQSTGGAAS